MPKTPPLPDFDLDSFMPYRFAVVAQKLSEGLARQYRTRFGISIPEWRVLAHLAHTGGVSVRDIEARVAMKKSKVSRAASQLEENGYITKTANTEDRRLVHLALTDKGQALMAQILPLANAFQKEILTMLGDGLPGVNAGLDRLLGEIELYDYWRSTSSYRVRIALGLAGLRWNSLPINLAAGEQSTKEHLARNPQGLVPLLEIDGQSLTQSLAIIEYLDETRHLNLLPTDPLARARVRALAHAIAMELQPVCNLRVAAFAAKNSGGGITMQSWMQEFIAPGLAAFEKMLEGGDYCYGTGITLADICLVPQLYNAERWEVDLANMPKIRRVARNLETNAAFAAAHPDLAPQS